MLNIFYASIDIDSCRILHPPALLSNYCRPPVSAKLDFVIRKHLFNNLVPGNMIIGLHILIVNYYVELNIFGKQGSP